METISGAAPATRAVCPLAVVPFPSRSRSSETMIRIRECHRCEDSSWVVVDGLGAKRCRCVRRRLARKALSVIPLQFGRPRLSRLQPRGDIHPKQIEVIEIIKARPYASYLLCGVNGSGKSHIAWALYRHALAQRRRVIACSLNQLLRQWRDWELRNPELRMTSCRDPSKGYPLILPEDLSSGAAYTVFLDEFEKAGVTDFTSRMLFELVQGLRDFGHQLIVTSNKDWAGLLDHWKPHRRDLRQFDHDAPAALRSD